MNMDKLSPIAYVIIVVLAFGVGILWQRVSDLENSAVAGVNTGNVANNVPGAAPEQPQVAEGKLSEEQVEVFVSASSENIDDGDNNPFLSSEDFIVGDPNAKVILIEYSDLECPFCQSFHGTAQQAVDANEGDVAWVYRHFPLDSIHPRARTAAIASECAASIGGNEAFWAYTGYVFENQQTALTDLEGAGAAVGLDQAALASCIQDGSLEANVDSDLDAGLAAGVTGTPGNFIINNNGEVWAIPGAVQLAQLQATIDEALASAI